MRETWRWFGPDDPVTLKDIRQAGVKGIVTSLHNVPNGETWSINDIRQRKSQLAEHRFDWEIVESLPVHESIKTGAYDRDEYIEKYIRSLENLSHEGILHVVYNFMALTDWTRTDLDYQDYDGAGTIRYDAIDIAVFDLYILKRFNAEKDYSAEILDKVHQRYIMMEAMTQEKLSRVILMGLPGTVDDIDIETFREKLNLYHNLGKDGLRRNLSYFLKSVLPVAEKLNIELSIHADDPPFSIFGLPRVASNESDLAFVLNEVSGSSNKLCFCSGTLGANPENDVPSMLKKFASSISFAHLRNVKREPYGSFFESKLFEGSLEMAEIASILLMEEQKRGNEHPIPFRPDHGQSILNDFHTNTYPGYPPVGRLKSLAELRGLLKGLSHGM